MNFNTVTAALDWMGIVAFAISGAIVASRKHMDIVGFVVLGTVTGIGGGTLRDLLLGQSPVFWVREPAYLVVCTVISAAMFFVPKIPESRYRLVLWIDAIGLALFAVTGAERALVLGSHPVVAIVMGVITASFGGIIRDVFANQSPVVLSYEIYVMAALAAAGVFVGLSLAGAPRDLAMACGLAVGAGLRALAMRFGWSLPRYTKN